MSVLDIIGLGVFSFYLVGLSLWSINARLMRRRYLAEIAEWQRRIEEDAKTVADAAFKAGSVAGANAAVDALKSTGVVDNDFHMHVTVRDGKPHNVIDRVAAAVEEKANDDEFLRAMKIKPE